MRLQKNTPALVPWPKFTTAGFLISPKTQDIEKLRNFFLGKKKGRLLER